MRPRLGVGLAAALRSPARTTVTMSAVSSKTKVYLDHDGGSDDFVALVYLLKHQSRFDLLGVTATPANSWWKAGASATRSILRIFADDDKFIPVAESTLTGTNKFPDEWRLDSCKVDLLPQLNCPDADGSDSRHHLQGVEHARAGKRAKTENLSGQQLLAETLLAATGPVTVIATGPLTNLAWVLDHYPEVKANIDRVLIMGGALDVPGNVFAADASGSDGTAEWNFFWDPQAVATVWDSDLELVLTPLDATNTAPVTKDMLLRLGRQHSSPSSALVGTIWSMFGAHLLEMGKPFFAWDLLTVAHLVHPELFRTRLVICHVLTEGESQGRVISKEEEGSATRYDTGEGRSRRRTICVVEPKDPQELMDVVLTELGSPS